MNIPIDWSVFSAIAQNHHVNPAPPLLLKAIPKQNSAFTTVHEISLTFQKVTN